MNTLVKFIGNDVFTDSMVIAEGTGNQHESVVSLIKTHQKSLKKFGNIRFTDLKSGNPKGGRPTRIYQLNEPQATLLVTFLDNNDIVVEFKVELRPPVLRNAPPTYGTSVHSLAGDMFGE